MSINNNNLKPGQATQISPSIKDITEISDLIIVGLQNFGSGIVPYDLNASIIENITTDTPGIWIIRVRGQMYDLKQYWEMSRLVRIVDQFVNINGDTVLRAIQPLGSHITLFKNSIVYKIKRNGSTHQQHYWRGHVTNIEMRNHNTRNSAVINVIVTMIADEYTTVP